MIEFSFHGGDGQEIARARLLGFDVALDEARKIRASAELVSISQGLPAIIIGLPAFQTMFAVVYFSGAEWPPTPHLRELEGSMGATRDWRLCNDCDRSVWCIAFGREA